MSIATLISEHIQRRPVDQIRLHIYMGTVAGQVVPLADLVSA